MASLSVHQPYIIMKTITKEVQLKTPLSEVMTEDPHRLTPTDWVEAADKLFQFYHIHHLPIVDTQDRVVGMLSYSDMLKISYGITLFRRKNTTVYNEALFSSLLIRDVMTEPVVTLREDQTVDEALQIFERNRFHAIPIVAGERLVGIVTPLDLLQLAFR